MWASCFYVPERVNGGSMASRFREITREDVGKALFPFNGRNYSVSGFIGRIMKQDVGKRVYLVIFSR